MSLSLWLLRKWLLSPVLDIVNLSSLVQLESNAILNLRASRTLSEMIVFFTLKQLIILTMAFTEFDDKLLCDKSIVSIDTSVTLLFENLENFVSLQHFCRNLINPVSPNV